MMAIVGVETQLVRSVVVVKVRIWREGARSLVPDQSRERERAASREVKCLS